MSHILNDSTTQLVLVQHKLVSVFVSFRPYGLVHITLVGVLRDGYGLRIAGPWSVGEGDRWDSHEAMKRAPHSMSNRH